MEEQNQEPLRINVVEEGHANTKKVHRFYFVKLWPSNLEARIEEAKNLMEKMRQEQIEISRNIKERKVC
jgi:hypothetical protein